jgi:hypothetical protein
MSTTVKIPTMEDVMAARLVGRATTAIEDSWQDLFKKHTIIHDGKSLFCELARECGHGSVPVPVTSSEVDEAVKVRAELDDLDKQIETLKKRRDQLRKDCKHTVLWDESGGFMYDSRHCLTCGRVIGLI